MYMYIHNMYENINKDLLHFFIFEQNLSKVVDISQLELNITQFHIMYNTLFEFVKENTYYILLEYVL